MGDSSLLWRMYRNPLTEEYRRIWVARKILVRYEVCTAKDSQDLPINDLYGLVDLLSQEGAELAQGDTV